MEPAKWPGFLMALNSAFRGGGGTIFLQDTRTAEVGFAELVGTDSKAAETYRDYYAGTNIWAKKAANWSEGSPRRQARPRCSYPSSIFPGLAGKPWPV
jgi:hypothetical protein